MKTQNTPAEKEAAYIRKAVRNAVEARRSFLLRELSRIKAINDNYKLRKLTGWGFWKGGEMISLDNYTANKIYLALRKEIKTAPDHFAQEVADLFNIRF